MATNFYFQQGVKSEQDLYESIVIESIKMYGQDVYYLPRDIVNLDDVFKDDAASRFNSSHKIEMYIENIDGFDGEGDIFTKFGVEIRDQATFDQQSSQSAKDRALNLLNAALGNDTFLKAKDSSTLGQSRTKIFAMISKILDEV